VEQVEEVTQKTDAIEDGDLDAGHVVLRFGVFAYVVRNGLGGKKM
jgi:hypothetical protein